MSDRKENWMSKEFRDLAERLKDGIYRFDIEARRFIFFNKTAIEIFAFRNASMQDITTKSMLLRIHPEDRDVVRAASRESRLPGRTNGEVEYRYARLDGTYRWMYDRWIVMRDSKGQPKYFEGIVIDNTKRKLAEEALKESRKKLRWLSSHLLKAQEKERRRISLELHDELGQALTVLKLQMGSIKKKLPLDSVTIRADIQNTMNYVDLIIENVRRLSHDLSPYILEDLGLDAALRLLIKEFVNHSDLQISCDVIPIDPLFSKENQIIIYRIFQETFTNIKRHSLALRTWISVKQKDGTVTFTIKDDGKGFDVKQPLSKCSSERGLGLTAMDERARMLGGALHIDSEKGRGTQIVFNIPTDEAKERHEFLSNSVG
ncbi:MAG: PAS domain-containing sensor histidine kinase [Syntrophobacteraceae bacterium]